MKITLCGSVRYKDQFDAINEELAVRGHNSITLSLWGKGFYGYIDDNNPLKQVLESIHFDKISLSEAIFVIDTDARTKHIGLSTRKEIEFAKSKGKTVWYLSEFISQINLGIIDPLFSLQVEDKIHDLRMNWELFDARFGHPLMLGVMQ